MAMLLVVTDDGRLLLHHRDDKPGIAHPGCWAGFGGAVEDGESVEEALRREVEEETGVVVTDARLLVETVDAEGDGRLVSLYYTVGGIRPDQIDLREGAGVGVHSLADLDTLPVSPFVRRAITDHLAPLLTALARTACEPDAGPAGRRNPPAAADPLTAANPPGQYATDRNLAARQRLWEHQEPAFDVVAWTLRLAEVGAAVRVLDVGCGNGRYLDVMAAAGVAAVGCDLSAGMLRSASAHRVVAADAMALPFASGRFDVVLAPHMLYHVADRRAAARELRRVLAPGGRCVVVANGAGHLGSLRALVEAAVDQPGWKWADRLAAAFSLENGGDQLADAFDQVACVRPANPGRAVVTDAEVIAGYVASVADHYGQDLPRGWDRVVDAVRSEASRVIEACGSFVVEGDVGAFVCS